MAEYSRVFNVAHPRVCDVMRHWPIYHVIPSHIITKKPKDNKVLFE